MAVAEKVKGIIAENLDVDEQEITPDASFTEDLGADSLDIVELVMAFEEAFGIEIALRSLFEQPTVEELAETIGWTVAVWFGIAFANFLVMRAFGLRVGVSETLFVLGWSLVGSLVPTPGGAAGAFHAATAAGFLFLGVEKELAAAVAIVLHLVDFGPAVLFGVFYAIKGDLSIARLRTLVSPNEDFENPVGEVQAR